jgi:hypothetical protein
MPKEPLPDMGDKIVSGVNSRGIPKKSAMGDKNEHKICNAPDAFSISITVISAISDGMIPIIILNPLLAPSMKTENTSIFLNSPYIIIKTTIMGITNSLAFVT